MNKLIISFHSRKLAQAYVKLPYLCPKPSAMASARKLFRLMYVNYLLLVISLQAHQQEDKVVCGINSYPFLNGSCGCLPGFLYVDNSRPSKGCYPKLLQGRSCSSNGSKMQRIEKTNWPDFDYDILKAVNYSECEQACTEDCQCMLVIHNNDLQQCWKKALPLPGGRADNSATAFVKVFKDVPVPPTTTLPHGTEQKLKTDRGKALIFIGTSLVAFSFVFAALLLFMWLYAFRPKLKDMQEHAKFDPVGLRAFSFQDIETATKGFEQEIGRGAFGKVYKGVLSDGRAIAVKKLRKELMLNEGFRNGEREFRTEMDIIGGRHHKNLVKLYGFCHEGSQRLLVYEYMPNGSLDSVLFNSTKELDWDLRLQIVKGIARGILYLHEECTSPILHCDLKPQNILLDENYHAKIADFGMSKLIGVEQTRTFTAARGTIGYIAPEWQKSMAVTVKVDVYSFGVVLLEIICCRKMFELHAPESEMVLCEWVYNCFKYGRLEKLGEEQKFRGIEKTQLERLVLVGLWCIQEDPFLRPSMQNVFNMLEGTIDIKVPPPPYSSFLNPAPYSTF